WAGGCAPSPVTLRLTVANGETRWANSTIAVNTPSVTPTARFSVATVPITVTIMTATRAAIGIIATRSPRVTDKIRISTPATNVEMRGQLSAFSDLADLHRHRTLIRCHDCPSSPR